MIHPSSTPDTFRLGAPSLCRPSLTLTTGSLDDGPGPQRFEQMGAIAVGSPRQSAIPRRQQHAEPIAQDAHLLEALIQLLEALANKGADAAARRSAAVPCPQDPPQVRQGKPHDQRALNQ